MRILAADCQPTVPQPQEKWYVAFLAAVIGALGGELDKPSRRASKHALPWRAAEPQDRGQSPKPEDPDEIGMVI